MYNTNNNNSSNILILIRTNGVLKEVPQFPIVDVHGKMWQRVVECMAVESKRAHYTTSMAKCMAKSTV